MEFTTTAMQNKNKILHQSFAYAIRKNLANGWESYECEKTRSPKTCLGKVKINCAQIHMVNIHTHSESGTERIFKLSEKKNHAQKNVEAAQQLLGNSVEVFKMLLQCLKYYSAKHSVRITKSVTATIRNDKPQGHGSYAGIVAIKTKFYSRLKKISLLENYVNWLYTELLTPSR